MGTAFGFAIAACTVVVSFGQKSMTPVFRSAKRNGNGWLPGRIGNAYQRFHRRIGRFERIGIFVYHR
jgi:hypothetical protein